MEHKVVMIRTLSHIANTIITEEEDNEEGLQLIKRFLSIASYSTWARKAIGRMKLHFYPP